MSEFQILNLNDQSSALMNAFTGAWLAGDKDQIRRILEHLNGGPDLDPDLLVKIGESGLANSRAPSSPIPPSLAVIHVGHSCNLSCTYCYAPRDHNRVTADGARGIAEFLGRIPTELFVQFMGGEPLLHIPEMTILLDELEAARKDRVTTFGIQTNGLLLDQPGNLDFLRNRKVHFGLSFDGPDGMSKARYGRRASVLEMRMVSSLRALKEEGHSCGIIAVVNRSNVNRLNELLAWCVELCLDRVQFTALLPKRKGDPSALAPEQATEAMLGVLRYWVEKKWYKKIAIDNFEALEDNLTSPHRPFMCRKHPCGAGLDQLAFDLNGDIYPCDYMVGTERFRMGNVATSSVEGLQASLVMEELSKLGSVHTLVRCGECCLLPICGHCPSSSFFNGSGLGGPRASCETDAAIIKEILINLMNDQEYADHVAAR